MRSPRFKASMKKTGKFLHSEWQSDKESSLVENSVEHLKRSPKETALYPDCPCGSIFLITVFRSHTLRPSLRRKLPVVQVCVYIVPDMYPCSEYNRNFDHLQTCWSWLPSSKFCPVSNWATEWQVCETLVGWQPFICSVAVVAVFGWEAHIKQMWGCHWCWSPSLAVSDGSWREVVLRETRGCVGAGLHCIRPLQIAFSLFSVGWCFFQVF